MLWCASWRHPPAIRATHTAALCSICCAHAATGAGGKQFFGGLTYLNFFMGFFLAAVRCAPSLPWRSVVRPAAHAGRVHHAPLTQDAPGMRAHLHSVVWHNAAPGACCGAGATLFSFFEFLFHSYDLLLSGLSTWVGCQLIFHSCSILHLYGRYAHSGVGRSARPREAYWMVSSSTLELSNN